VDRLVGGQGQFSRGHGLVIRFQYQPHAAGGLCLDLQVRHQFRTLEIIGNPGLELEVGQMNLGNGIKIHITEDA